MFRMAMKLEDKGAVDTMLLIMQTVSGLAMPLTGLSNGLAAFEGAEAFTTSVETAKEALSAGTVAQQVGEHVVAVVPSIGIVGSKSLALEVVEKKVYSIYSNEEALNEQASSSHDPPVADGLLTSWTRVFSTDLEDHVGMLLEAAGQSSKTKRDGSIKTESDPEPSSGSEISTAGEDEASIKTDPEPSSGSEISTAKFPGEDEASALDAEDEDLMPLVQAINNNPEAPAFQFPGEAQATPRLQLQIASGGSVALSSMMAELHSRQILPNMQKPFPGEDPDPNYSCTPQNPQKGAETCLQQVAQSAKTIMEETEAKVKTIVTDKKGKLSIDEFLPPAEAQKPYEGESPCIVALPQSLHQFFLCCVL